RQQANMRRKRVRKSPASRAMTAVRRQEDRGTTVTTKRDRRRAREVPPSSAEGRPWRLENGAGCQTQAKLTGARGSASTSPERRGARPHRLQRAQEDLLADLDELVPLRGEHVGEYLELERLRAHANEAGARRARVHLRLRGDGFLERRQHL